MTESPETAGLAHGKFTPLDTCCKRKGNTMMHLLDSGRYAARHTCRWARSLLTKIPGERGAATAEYAIVTLAAVAFAGLLVAILRSDEVRSMLLGVVQRALSLGG